MKPSLLAICVFIYFLQTCHPSHIKPTEGIYVLSVCILQSSAIPAYFYEMMDDFEDINAKYEILHTTYKTVVFRPTTTTTEETIQDEWKLRGEHRIKCVDEVQVDPKKIVRLMSLADWKTEDLGVKKWVLCVLNKMHLMSKQGVFRLDVALSKITSNDREDAESIIEHCLPKTKMQPEDIAWQYIKCHSQAKGNFSAISVF